jgi:alpha-L-fucosidase 2
MSARRLITGVFLAIFITECPALVKIACIGNSITEGAGLSDPYSQSYPAKLQKLLATSNCQVQNDGVSARTLTKGGWLSYWTSGKLPDVFAFQPDIITIKLGTNDTKPENWEQKNNGAQFKTDYFALVDTLAAMPSHPKIYLILPVPVYPNPTAVSWGIRDSIIQKQIPIIKEVAAARSLTVIDANTPLKNFPQYFKKDGVHPDSSAEDTLAHIVYRALAFTIEVMFKPNDQNVNSYGRFDFSGSSTAVKFNWPTNSSLERITIQSQLSGVAKEITVFDCAGRSLRKLVTNKRIVSLTREFSLSRGVYLIKTSVSPF